jgi:hypothetical protein
LMLRLSAVEALRECEDAILLDYVTSSSVIRERICSTFIALVGGGFCLIDTRRGETCQSELVLHAKKFAYWSLPAFRGSQLSSAAIHPNFFEGSNNSPFYIPRRQKLIIQIPTLFSSSFLIATSSFHSHNVHCAVRIW